MDATASPFRHVQMVGSDKRMDQRGNFDMPVNPLPVKCQHCTFPDLDFVPQPYFLAKGNSDPNEMAPAELGNFFVRERTRKVLEEVASGQCEFHPTHHLKTQKQTEWFLAVPKAVVRTATVKASVPRCPECGESKVAHPGGNYEYPADVPLGERTAAMAEVAASMAGSISVDVFKSLNWSSSESTGEESGWYWMHILKHKSAPAKSERWTRVMLGRELYFSIRLQSLLQRLRIKGLVRFYVYTEAPNQDELEWVEEQYQRLVRERLAEPALPESKPGLDKWFQSFLRNHKRKGRRTIQWADLEEEHGVRLPPSYKEFTKSIGEMAFHNVDEQEGFTARILSPNNLDYQTYRIGNELVEDEVSRVVDGVMFASTDHGDCFCFDVSSGPEYPVFLFDHEMSAFEAYAASFQECVRRFAESST